MNCCCSAKTKRKFFRKPRNAGGHYFLYFFCSCPGTSIQSFFQPARWLCTISVIRQAKEREVVHKHYVSLQVRHIPVTGRHLNVAHFEDQLRLPNADPDTMPLGDLLVLSRGAAQRPSVRSLMRWGWQKKSGALYTDDVAGWHPGHQAATTYNGCPF